MINSTLIKEISFVNSTALEEIEDIENDNLDVFVELEDGFIYTLVIATAQNLISLMDKERMNYSEPGPPFIIVKKLTKEIIEEAVKAYVKNDAYWLKSYYFAGEVDMAIFNRLQAQQTELLKELDELDDS